MVELSMEFWSPIEGLVYKAKMVLKMVLWAG
jgi:hypothetical protein